MKSPSPLLLLLLLATVPIFSSCTSLSKKPPAPALSAVDKDTKRDGKSVHSKNDLEEYDAATISDPLEPMNRGIFWFNHGIYTVLLRPITKVYRAVLPQPARDGVYHAYENVKFPVRFVNNTLQGNFQRAGQETGKFLVNTVVGVGGILRPSEGIPALAGIPAADTGQTFAKWGIGHGPYLVLPLLGPSSVRDGIGLAGDFALNPVSWVTIWYGGYAWTIAIPLANTMRSIPIQLDQYDAATGDALDRYLALRSFYIQYRNEAALK